jgi:sigma-54 dependent transcriptional regulator, acetoin dehydrogenase operon transcriptional activator AcoR
VTLSTKGAPAPRRSIPADPSRAYKQIAKSWEAFVGSRKLTGAVPRPVIARSWERSRELGIDPFLERAPTALSAEEIEAILAREDLGRAGRGVLDEFSRAVEGTGHVILLADALGRVIYSAGHAPIRPTLDRLNLAPGGSWSETAVGPNGIGTPIALGRPEIVFGPEHYCREWQPWVCYGCPVWEPGTGTILGGVDITGPARKVHGLTAAFTVSVARSIEQRLLVFELERREALTSAFRGLERRWPADGILVANERGKVFEMNSAAAAALGCRAGLPPGASLAELAPELWGSARQVVESGSAREEPVELGALAGRDRRVLCLVEPVTRDGRPIGSAVVLTGHPTVASRERSSSAPGRRVPLVPSTRYTFADLLGQAPSFRAALDLARAAARAPHDRPILLVGESGTGKELVAQAIHSEGQRARGPFIPVNCGALPRELVESELFGYATGAFTGARREGQAGKFEAAHRGTIFLDEIDSVPLEVQGKFLRVLEGAEVVRLSSTIPVRVDVRVVAASSIDLTQRVREGHFRLDLFHRLGVVEIVLPPLRERGGDVLLLARAFLDREGTGAGRAPLVLSPPVAEHLVAYDWPGNVRELQNLCTRWGLTVHGPEITPDHLPRHIRAGVPMAPGRGETGDDFRRAQDAIIRRTLEELGGDVAGAARRLGIAKTTIYRRLKRWGATP